MTSPDHPQEIRSRKRDLILFAPKTWHTMERSSDCSLFRVSLRPDEIQFGYRINPGLPLMVHTHRKPAGAWLQGTFDRVVARRFSEDERQALASMLIWELLLLLESAPTVRVSKGLNTWRIVREYVETHCHLPLDRTMIGRRFHLHPTHVSRLYKQFANQTFQQHLEACRLACASGLLRGSAQLNVAEIAAVCGFASHSYFTKVFRKQYGASPTSYRLLGTIRETGKAARKRSSSEK